MSPANRVDHQPAFLLSATPWRETSLLAELFSRDYGRVALVARSARKRQSELRGVLVPFVPVCVSWYGREELKTLHRAEWLGGWPQPQNRALFSGLYANELVAKLTAREDPHPGIYHELAQLMHRIATEDNHAAALRHFEWALLQHSGLAPDLRQDGHGRPLVAERHYYVQPEQPVWPRQAGGNEGLAVSGAALQALAGRRLSDAAHLQEVLRLNRLLLDFRLPEGIKSRQVLQQLQQFR
ncbi:MAG: DNA repair protein RecO [Eikenella sp.]|nr:DNA repair protein RecO [Eikenella sp.]